MPWCKIVEVDGKQVMFMNEGDRVTMAVRGDDWGGKPGVVTLDVQVAPERLDLNTVATTAGAMMLLDRCVKPYLGRLQQ